MKAWPLIFALLAGCAHFSRIEEVPSPFRQRLGAHKDWLTVAVLDHARGHFPPSEASVIKRWHVESTGGVAFKMHESQSSSLVGLFGRLHRGEKALKDVDLTEAVDPNLFFPAPGFGLEASRPMHHDAYAFRAIDHERFQLLVNGGRLRIVFTPAPDEPLGAVASNADIGIWTTPFGAESELLAHVKKLLLQAQAEAKEKVTPEALPGVPATGRFLHHDLSGRHPVKVQIDPSVPEAYRASVAHAVKKWNTGFKHQIFTLAPGVKPIDQGECLSSFIICVRWFGADKLAFTGANGYTEVAFDPDSGLIVGAVVSIINDDVNPPLKEMNEEDRRRLGSGRPDPDWVAGAMHRYTEFNETAHPLPETYVEYLLLHEMGHASGFGHNFYLSGTTSVERPITSVMAYPPFPLGHLANYLADADLRRIALVYDKGTHAAPDYCSTLDAMVPAQDQTGLYHRAANCDIFVVGDPADWYIRLAKRGRFGVFTGYPDLSHLSEELRAVYRDMAAKKRLPPLNVLTRLGFILGDAAKTNAQSRARVTAYLCELASDRAAIVAQLKAYHAVTLQCPIGRPAAMLH